MKYLKLINNERKSKLILSTKGCRWQMDHGYCTGTAYDYCKYEDMEVCTGTDAIDYCIIEADIDFCTGTNARDIDGYY